MSSVYADVIVDITNEKLDRTFQYKVPPELTGEISPGTAVQIPFGNGNRTITGYVLSVGNEPKYPQDRMKAILAVQKDAATVETKLIALAAWMRHTYGSTMIQALKTVLPVKVKARGKETREIALLADPARCEELLENYRKKNYKARIRLLNALLAQPVLPGPVVSKKLKITADTLHVMGEQGEPRRRPVYGHLRDHTVRCFARGELRHAALFLANLKPFIADGAPGTADGVGL